MPVPRHRVLLPALALLAAARLAVAADFDSEMRAAAQRYAARAEEPDAKRAVLEGHLSQSNAMLQQLVPDDRKTAADWFVLGNMLYRADIAYSDAAMRKAESLRPDEPAIWMERAMDEQRAHHCAAAVAYYDRLHAVPEWSKHATSWAYSAQCKVVLGDAKGALDDWLHADFRHRHVGIEEAMYEIFSTTEPRRERETRLDAAARGDRFQWCELMELETFWETNWWNKSRATPFIEQDTGSARAALKADAPALAEFELCRDAAMLADAEFVDHLRAAGIWGTRRTLPDSPRLAYMAVRALVSTKTAAPQDVLDAWGDALAKRQAAAPADRTTLELLAFLYQQVHDKARLAPLDQQGWKVLHLRTFAESAVLSRFLAHQPVDADLALAFAEFPDSDILAKLRVQLTREPVARRRALLDFIASTFANVATPREGGAGLNAYMSLLIEDPLTSK
jgi:hypothetical protein